MTLYTEKQKVFSISDYNGFLSPFVTANWLEAWITEIENQFIWSILDERDENHENDAIDEDDDSYIIEEGKDGTKSRHNDIEKTEKSEKNELYYASKKNVDDSKTKKKNKEDEKKE